MIRTEDDLLHAVCGRALALGVMAMHVRDSRLLQVGRGFPDLVLAGPAAVCFAELKMPGRRLEAQQAMWRWRLVGAGATWHLWTPADWQAGAVEAELRRLAGLA